MTPNGDRAKAESAVLGPAIALMITGGLTIFGGLVFMAFRSMMMSFMSYLPPDEADRFNEAMAQQNPSTISAYSAILIVAGAATIFGAIQMKSLKSYAFAMVAAIV